MSRLSILSYTTVFPRPGDANLGLFVRARLQEMAKLASVQVVAPVAWIEYGNHAKRFPGQVPTHRKDGLLHVAHPRWLYLPGLKALTPILLALFTFPCVRKQPADIIDAHFGFPDGAAAALLALVLRKPFAVTLRGNEPAHAESWLVRAWIGWALRRAARVITVSERLRQFAIGLGVAPDRAVTIPNGINPEVFYPRDRKACRAKFGMDDASRHILSVGYLIPRKGHHHAIEAVAALRRQGKAVELWIAGNPGREGAAGLRELVQRLEVSEAVHFVGAVPHETLAEYMTAADVLCLASSREGWPNVVHEALACGTPVVATDVGGVPDMLPDPAFGTVVPIGDQTTLQTALEKALYNQWDRAAIAEWGRSRTWRSVAEEAVKVLDGGATR